MDLSSIMGGNTPGQERELAIEYTAQAASSLICGEVKLTVGEYALGISALFDAAQIPFAEMNSVKLADYAVTVTTDSGDYIFSLMGQWTQPFYDALYTAYNKAVLRCFFIKNDPVFMAKGEYRYTENGESVSGAAPVHIYENSVVFLPPDLSARRIPLCFAQSMEKGDYELNFRLNTEETYTCSKLGYDTSAFIEAAQKQLRKLREESLATVRQIDPSLSAAQASQLARLMPKGAAASAGAISSIAPSFIATLEEKLSETCAGESYKAFKEFCDPAQIYIGFRKNETTTDTAAAGLSEMIPPEAYLLWMIAPSPGGRYAAVEFAETDAATFVYRTQGAYDVFVRQLNRALEAINFRREVIRLSNEELGRAENADYLMADKRTASLQFVRANFAGRVIHAGVDTWMRRLNELWSE